MIRELCENANTYTPLYPGDERIVDGANRFVIWFGTGVEDPHWTVVQRLRIPDDAVVETVAEIRALVRDRGKRSCTWEIADGATPSSLVEWLLANGCHPDVPAGIATGMVLDATPAWSDEPGLVTRRATTVEEALEAARIAGDAFEMPEAALAEILEETERTWAPDDTRSATYLAYLGGKPVARATAAFTEHGVLLFGGATRADARGHGAYRALVRARWDDAVARGTPVLVTHAGAMSRPILERLGFRPVSRIHILLDELGG